MDACGSESCVDPLGPPDWRWLRACWLYASPCRRRRRRRSHLPDPAWLAPLLALARTVYPTSRQRRGPRVPVPPELMLAFELYQSRDCLRWELEARLLAGQSDLNIAASTTIAPAIAAMYEQAFFAVRSRLAAADYIMDGVIGYTPFQGFDEGDLRGLWAYFGYAAGPRMLELVMAVSRGRPLPAWALNDASSRAASELLEIGVKAMLTACTGAMTASKLRKLIILRSQMAELKRPLLSKGSQTLVDVARHNECEPLSDLGHRAAAPTDNPKPVVRDGADRPLPRLGEVA
jgi:hypothetical protein